MVLLLTVSVPATLRMPPPPIPLAGTVFQLTSLLLRVSVGPGPGPIVPLAIPPPAPEAMLAVTTLRLSCSVPAKLMMPPPKPAGPWPETLPPVTVIPLSVRPPPAGPEIAMRRKLLLFPAIVAPPPPLIVIDVVISGSALAPRSGSVLFANVNEYVQPDSRLITPPPPAFAALTAATSPAVPPPAPEHATLLDPDARAVAPPTAARATHATTAEVLSRHPKLSTIRALPSSDLAAIVGGRRGSRQPNDRARHAADLAERLPRARPSGEPSNRIATEPGTSAPALRRPRSQPSAKT